MQLRGKFGDLKLKFLKRFIKSLPFIRRVVQIYLRRQRAIGSLQEKLRYAKSWSYKRTEFSNYYYALTPRNRKDLAFLISHIFHELLQNVEEYFSEIENDNSEKTKRNFIIFKEEPANHFYSGAGIGISFKLQSNKY